MELLAIFVALQVADIITTHRVLEDGGSELNPLLAAMFKDCGVVATLIVVKGIVIGIVLAAWHFDQMPWQALAGMNLLYAVVVTNNYCHMRWRKGFVQLVKERLT